MPKLTLPQIKLGFPLTKASWPNGVNAKTERSKLGANFETDWSRRYPVRLLRAMILDTVVRPVAKVAASPEIFGEDRLVGVSGPVIFAANHASHLDTPLILSLLPERFRHHCVVAAGADYFFDKRWKAYVWSGLLAAIPIERNKVSRRSAQTAQSLLGKGWNLLIFPEGGRSPDGLGQTYKGGVAYLAQRAGVKVIPVFLEGTYEILGKGASKFRSGKTTLTFGHAISGEDKDTRAFNAEIEAAIDALALETHTDWWTAQTRKAKGDVPPLNPPNRDSWISDWRRTAHLPKETPKPAWPKRFGSKG